MQERLAKKRHDEPVGVAADRKQRIETDLDKWIGTGLEEVVKES